MCVGTGLNRLQDKIDALEDTVQELIESNECAQIALNDAQSKLTAYNERMKNIVIGIYAFAKDFEPVNITVPDECNPVNDAH